MSMLSSDPDKRPTVTEVKNHPWMKKQEQSELDEVKKNFILKSSAIKKLTISSQII